MKALAVIGLVFACSVAMPIESFSRDDRGGGGGYRGDRVDRTDHNGNNVSAHCRDGTFSHSHRYRGACNGHRGVAHWW
jgi:Protein of unknown function (DUF3761)